VIHGKLDYLANERFENHIKKMEGWRIMTRGEIKAVLEL